LESPVCYQELGGILFLHILKEMLCRTVHFQDSMIGLYLGPNDLDHH